MTREGPGTRVAVGDISITPVERVSITHQIVGGVVLFRASKRLVAVVVHTATGEERFVLDEAESEATPH